MRRDEATIEVGTRLVDRVEALVGPLLAPLGYEVVIVEQVSTPDRPSLRISIDRLDGTQVSLEDCVKVNRRLDESAELDALMPGAYNLEVSSPGVNRPLVRERDYARFVGEKAQVTTREPLEGRRNFSGRIAAVEAGDVRLDLGRGGMVAIPIAQIAKAHLKPDTKDLFKRLSGRAPAAGLVLEVAEDERPGDAPADNES